MFLRTLEISEVLLFRLKICDCHMFYICRNSYICHNNISVVLLFDILSMKLLYRVSCDFHLYTFLYPIINHIATFLNGVTSLLHIFYRSHMI